FSGEIKSVTEGPTVITFLAECTKGVPLRRVPSVERSLGSRFGCSVICLPCFSSGAIEIQISRRKRVRVDLCDVLTSESYQKTCKNGLLFAMGVDAGGKALCKDLTDLCCLALAGESGTGKSVFLHSFLTGLICKYSPEELRLLLIDLKGGEFVPAYDKLPHLVTESAVTDLAAAMHMLDWAIEEGERRKEAFVEIGDDLGEYVSNLDEYNEFVQTPLPKIVVVIDEINELYLAHKKEVSQKIVWLIQSAHATGIYLVISSSSMSDGRFWFDVSHHSPALVLFRVNNMEESLYLLKRSCGENLNGSGDFLYALNGALVPTRGQAAYVRTDAVKKVVEYVRERYPCPPMKSAMEAMLKKQGKEWAQKEETIDPIYLKALKFAVATNRVSLSTMQRALGITFNRAGQIIEWMEKKGYISEYTGSPSRKVFITDDEIYERYEARVQKITVDALRLAVETGNASIYFFQRCCNMSYQQAKKAIGWMEKSGYVSAHNGVYPRRVLLSRAQFNETFEGS
ncbi:MAG: hypothetical protein J6A46_04710, partial [Clostridia bacterium]|nr:hypothetical protein [Clostridia bacterium]